MIRKSLLLVALLACVFSLRAQVFINEVCAANGDINYDPQYYNFSAWVELYNAGSASANIGGYYLSDDSNNRTKWQIPAGTSISAKGFLIIWCDDMSTGLHTNFSLDPDGEEVALSSSASLLVDKVTFTKQHTNVSFGRTTDGGATLGYIVAPSPGAANSSTSPAEALEKPMFSLVAGRYSGTQTLSLSHPIAGVSIHFTVDGSEPTNNSSLYSTAISISTTRTIKARAFKNGSIPSKTETATYFISEHAFSLPVISISTNPAYLWDNTIGIYTDGTNGTTGNCRDTPVNWNRDWDRHAMIEYFEPAGQRKFDQSIDIRIGGACSRNQAQKSFVVKARDKFVKKTIDEKLFSAKESESYGGFMLRNSGNDFNVTMFRDAFMQQLPQGQMDVDYMAYQPTIFYLNGQYWGIQNMREKIDADYIESNYGITKDDVDLLETGGNPIEGTADRYNLFMDSLATKVDRAAPSTFAFIERYIDVQEYLNYLATEIYVCNTDWPGNNVKFWRQRSNNGKFRWILWDTDFGFALYTGASYPTHPTLNFATDPNSGVGWPNPPWSTLQLRLLLDNPTFKARFAQTLTTAMATTFHPTRVNQLITEFQNRITAEMPYHKQRWGGNVSDWTWELQRLRDFASQRHTFMQQHIADFFGLSENVKVNVKSTPANLSAYDINGVVIDNAVVDASYYKGLPIQVKAKPHDGSVIKNWKVKKRESQTFQFVDRGAAWKYFDQGTTPANWQTEAFNDASWPQGNAQLGYGDGDEATVVGYGGNASNKHITTYFRKSFTIVDVTNMQNATGTVLFDDGVVIYLNGTEVYRNNLPGGAISMSTLALGAIADENAYSTFTIDKSLLKTGVNVIAVEIHQSGVTSSDIGFDLSLSSYTQGNEIEFISTEEIYSDIAASDITLEASFEQVSVINNIVINEFSASNSEIADEFDETDDWIELYNAGSTAVDLAGFYLTDDLTNKTKFKLAEDAGEETVIGPGEYKVLWADEQMHQGPLHVNFKLSADGESIGLYQITANGTNILDEVTYSTQQQNVSSSRIPNATGPFIPTSTMTPGEENSLTTGIDEEESIGLRVYPNPTTGNVLVSADKLITTVDVFDMLGAKVGEINVNSFSKEIPLEKLRPGFVLLRVHTTSGTKSVKVVKQ
jgi:hypothetical protein